MNFPSSNTTRRPASVLSLGALLAATPLLADYTVGTVNVIPEGQFTVSGGTIHYWSSAGYSTYNIATGTNTNVAGLPSDYSGNGYGDPFGVYDSTTGTFYAASYNTTSAVYAYSSGSWASAVTIPNAYGADTHAGQLYISGLSEPWNGGYGQTTYIYAYDSGGRQDTLIETAGNSAGVAVAPNGDVYYATYSDNTLYRWSAAQVASVTNDLYASGAVDTFLTLGEAEWSLALPGGGNGIAVDDAGNVFFTVNGTESILAMVDDSQPDGYTVIMTPDEGSWGWYGSISVEGDFLSGDPLYFSNYGSPLYEVTYVVPEPSFYAMFLGLGTLLVVRRRRASNAF